MDSFLAHSPLDYNFKSAAPWERPTNEITVITWLSFREPLSGKTGDERDDEGITQGESCDIIELVLNERRDEV